MHLFPMSVRLLIKFGFCRFLMIKNFSERHKSHFVWPFSKVLHFFKIFHSMLGVVLALFSHRYFDKVVSFLYFSCRKLFFMVVESHFET